MKNVQRIADIGCGSGGLTRHLARLAPPGSQIMGYDISPDSIRLAQAKTNGLPIAFECVDAQTHRPDARFDRLVSRFGIMFFPDEDAAFANLKSWLVPGGQACFAVWADYSDNPWQGVFREVAGKITGTPNPKPGEIGPVRYADAKRFRDRLIRYGFRSVTVSDWFSKLAMGGGLSAAEAAVFGLSAFWGNTLPPSHPDYKVALRQLTDRLSDHEVDGCVTMDARVHIITAKT